jgi:hypothetical protein
MLGGSAVRHASLVVIVFVLALLGAGTAQAATPVTITNVTVQSGTATITWTPLSSDHGVNSNGLYNGSFTICVVPHGDVPDGSLWVLCSSQSASWNAIIESHTTDSTATQWSGAPTSPIGITWQTGEYDAYVVYFTCDAYGVCITPVASAPYSFNVAVKPAPAPPTPKPPPDSIYVSETVEGGAHQWLKVNVSYFFGAFCSQYDPNWPDCSPAPNVELTVYRLSRNRIKVHNHYKIVTTQRLVYYLSDTGINDASGGGEMVVPPLVPSFDFKGGARNGAYRIKVTSDLNGKSSDTTPFQIIGGQLIDG